MKRLLRYFTISLIFLFSFGIAQAENPRLAPYILLSGNSIDSVRGDLQGTFSNADTNRWKVDPETGFYAALAAHTAGFEWAGGLISFSCDPASQNEILQSRTFTHASWTNGSTIGAMDAVGVTGVANSACTLTDDDAGSAENIDQNITVPDDSNTHCGYIFVRKTSGTPTYFLRLRLYLTGGSGIIKDVRLNTTTGAISGANGGIIDLADKGLANWWLLYVTIDNDGSGNTDLEFRFWPAFCATINGAQDNSLTGTQIVDQAQVELDQAFPTNPIVTTVSAVSRTSEGGCLTWSIPASGSGTIFSEDLGSELVTDGDCSSDSFVKGTGWSHDAVNEEYDCDGSQVAASNLYQSGIVSQDGSTYKFVFEIKNYSAGAINRISFGAGANVALNLQADGTYTYYNTDTGSTNTRAVIRADVDFVGSIDNVSLKKVTNPSSEGGPPRGTVICWVRPGFDSTVFANSGILACRDGASSLFYFANSAGRIASTDGTSGSNITDSFSLGDWQKCVLKYGDLSSNVPQLTVGRDSGSGVVWDGTPGDYDGAFGLNANIVIGAAGFSFPIHIGLIQLWPDPPFDGAIVDDTVIDAGGSP